MDPEQNMPQPCEGLAREPQLTKDPAKTSTYQGHASNFEQNMPISDPQLTKEPAKTSLGTKLEELQSDDVHEEPIPDLNVAAITNSDYSNNVSSTAPIANNSTNTTDAPPNSPVSTNSTMGSDSHHTIDTMPTTPYVPPPHEDNKLGFIVFAVELVAALTNLAVSSKTNHNQLLIYVVVACSTLAFSVSSTALVLHKKRPAIAKKMQKAAFLIGTFGLFGIMGMLLPSTITWYFTISAFLVCMLMFAIANFLK